MRRAADGDGADSVRPRQLHRLVHGEIGDEGAEAVVAVDQRRRADIADDAGPGAAVDAPAFDHAQIVRQQPHAVAVDPDARGVQHRARPRFGRRLIRAGRQEGGMAERGEGGFGRADVGGVLRLGVRSVASYGVVMLRDRVAWHHCRD